MPTGRLYQADPSEDGEGQVVSSSPALLVEQLELERMEEALSHALS
jgi:hypothetical protein